VGPCTKEEKANQQDDAQGKNILRGKRGDTLFLFPLRYDFYQNTLYMGVPPPLPSQAHRPLKLCPNIILETSILQALNCQNKYGKNKAKQHGSNFMSFDFTVVSFKSFDLPIQPSHYECTAHHTNGGW